MKGWIKSLDNWIYQNRALSLLLTVMLTLALVGLANWLSESDLFRQFFFPKVCDKTQPAKCDPLEWKDLFQAAIIVLGLPVAFLLWHWRDTNVRDQIEEQRKQVENARKDTNLKEFFEIQRQAAGLFDIELDEHAQTDLQIAGLHQLREFLRSDQPKSFRRAAFELIWPSDGIAKNRVQSYHEWNQASGGSQNGDFDKYKKYVSDCHDALDRVEQARISIIHDEWQQFFHSGFPLNGRDFSFIKLPNDADLSGLDLSSCRFIRAIIEGVKFNNANLRYSVFDHAFASNASFIKAQMFGAYLDCSGLTKANFQQAELGCAFMRCSSAGGILLQGTALELNRDDELDLGNALFDDSTSYGLSWYRFTDQEKIEAYDRLRTKGARHVNDTKKTDG